MELLSDSFRWMEDSSGTWLCVKTNRKQAERICSEIKADKSYDVEIKQHRARRSTNANNYLWRLLDEVADVLGRSKESLYLEYVRKCGPYKDFVLTEEEAKTFRVAWSRLGTGWPTEQVDFSPDGEKVVIRAYYGSSQYNTKQMSRLIDMAVQDAKDVGIETLTPAELDRMKQDWRHANNERA